VVVVIGLEVVVLAVVLAVAVVVLLLLLTVVVPWAVAVLAITIIRDQSRHQRYGPRNHLAPYRRRRHRHRPLRIIQTLRQGRYALLFLLITAAVPKEGEAVGHQEVVEEGAATHSSLAKSLL
jgi:hypothetical protein